MVAVKFPNKFEGLGENIYAPLCSGIYMGEVGSLIHWSGTESDARTNLFNWFKEENDWIVPEDHYNEYFNN